MFFLTVDDPAIFGRLNECLETILNKAQVFIYWYWLFGWKDKK